ncbi:hypothetical protein F8B42_01255 [Klebsiella aerogenes]|nr:hypothetical protein F8B42_01255 [Klebsiella aerogenes]
MFSVLHPFALVNITDISEKRVILACLTKYFRNNSSWHNGIFWEMPKQIRIIISHMLYNFDETILAILIINYLIDHK